MAKTVTIEETAQALIDQLREQLARQEDAESAIDVYKKINWIINQLDEVKDTALDLAEQDMKQRGLDTLRAPAGSAGWTEPKVRQLNENAWMEAIAREPRLRQIQREHDQAQAAIEQAQEPYLELPAPRFYIR